MKTKLYAIITGLLMSACITSYGQEIIGEFISSCQSYTCEIVETSDGNLLVGSSTHGASEYMVYKLSPEGTLIDSVALPGTANPTAYLLAQFFEIPSMPDYFLAAFHVFHNNYIELRFILIDSNLTIVNNSRYNLVTGTNYGTSYTPFLVMPNETVWFHYGDLSGEETVRHFVRFNLYGSFLDDNILTGIPSYTNLTVFSETPLTYCFHRGYTSNDTIHQVNYIYDNNLHLIDSIECEPINSSLAFSTETGFLFPFTQPGTAANMLFVGINTDRAFITYDKDGAPLAYHIFSGLNDVGFHSPVVTDQNTIYCSYGKEQFGISQYLLRLNSDLDVVWSLPLPCSGTRQHSIQSKKVTQNGNIVVGLKLKPNPNTSLFQILIISENDPTSIPEIEAIEKPFELYPNPVKDNLALRFDDGAKPESVELYDLAGRLVGTKPNGLESIDMSAMPSGVYMLRVTMKNGTSYHEKIVKE